MKEFALNGKKREAVGKKASKMLRKEGMIPCNLYGENTVDGKPVAMAFMIPMSELRKVVYTPEVYVVNLSIDGEPHKAVIKELQFHHIFLLTVCVAFFTRGLFAWPFTGYYTTYALFLILVSFFMFKYEYKI